jgi:EAL domain-containing protein (putative c-di-GMP-specific phosphodiesterase class I)
VTRDDGPGDAKGDGPTLSIEEAKALASRDASTSDAATIATRDAETVARSAAGTTMAAQEAVAAAGLVATSAKHATATTVAAAAGAAAELAARAATDVHAEAVTRALEVAASAVAALETIAAELPLDMDPDEARRAAAAVAATVAAEVIAQAKATADAADRVANAVSMAAEAAALAAATAAAIVELAANTAEAAAHGVAGSSAATEAASDVAVSSSTRVADLAQRRLSILRRAPLVAELRGALERDELRLHYQPMYSMSSGAIVAVEALLRWQHPTRGLLAPAEFLDIAEGPTLVTPIGDWVVETAVSQASAWQRTMGERTPVMWVNISCDQLGNQHLPDVIDLALSGTGLAPGSLGLEVTERQIVGRADDVAVDLLRLRGLGVAMAVDDFGTGFASLDYLRRFTFDEIKIDRSFISGLGLDRTDTAVTSSIIALGRSLDLTVVAEGVETRAQFERLQELGCEVSQGYLHHRPATGKVISELLEQSVVVR